MKKLYFITALITMFTISGCSSYYGVLESVKNPSGDNSTAIVKESGTYHPYIFEDDKIKIVWSTDSQLEFDLTNKTENDILVPWDDIIYINWQKKSRNIVTGNARRITMNQAQKPTRVSPGTSINEMIIPVNLVKSDNVSPVFMSTEYGKDARVVFPLEINGETVKYEFNFTVDK